MGKKTCSTELAHQTSSEGDKAVGTLAVLGTRKKLRDKNLPAEKEKKNGNKPPPQTAPEERKGKRKRPTSADGSV